MQELKGLALNEFILKRTGKTWDELPVESSTLKDIDQASIKFFIKKALKSKRIAPDAEAEDYKTLLNNLHLINDNGKLKNAALLLFGNDPNKYFMSAYFKIGRFGKSDADLRFQDVVEGNLIEMADKVMKILKNNERQIESVNYVKKNAKITNSIYQKLCNVSERTALRDLEELGTKGIFQKKGEKKGTYYELKVGG